MDKSIKNKIIYMNTSEAIEFASDEGIYVTDSTLRYWCNHYPIAKKIGGRWGINQNKFALFLEGKDFHHE